MPGFEASVAIGAPAADVFDVVSDLATHSRWAADELTLERTGERTWRSISRAKGRTFHADIIVTVSEPGKVFEFVSSDETGTYGHRFALRELPDGCELTRSVTARRLGVGQQALFWLTLIPVRRPALRSSLARLASFFA
jgi:uncharacterized protein YndB with AHSA1/START domain